MIELTGDIWTEPGVDAIVITTNGVVKNDGCAVMGRGVARQAAMRYPWLPARLGTCLTAVGNRVFIYDTPGDDAPIITFPVKDRWWERADLGLILKSCRGLAGLVDSRGLRKVVMPRPGCGNGGLDWGDVRKVVGPRLDDRFVVVEWRP